MLGVKGGSNSYKRSDIMLEAMPMRQVPLERDINIAINGPFWVEVANPEHPFTAMLISRSRGTCLIDKFGLSDVMF